jgi:hypothetical protein
LAAVTLIGSIVTQSSVGGGRFAESVPAFAGAVTVDAHMSNAVTNVDAISDLRLVIVRAM